MVCCQADEIASHLNAEGNIEIFGDVALGPEEIRSIGTLAGNALDCLPAEECIVTDEGSGLSGSDSKANGRVNLVREESDAVLEVVSDDLHDARRVLDDGDFGGQEHFSGTVKKAVNGLRKLVCGTHRGVCSTYNTGIGVDNQNVFSHADVAISPGLSIVIQNLIKSSLVKLILLRFRDITSVSVTFADFNHFSQDILGLVRDVEGEVHVRGFLELSATDESINTVLWTCDPANVVIGIEISPGLSLIFWKKLKTIVVDEDAGSSTVQFVMRNGSFKRGHSGNDDAVQTLLVDWHLDRDVAGAEANLISLEDIGTNRRIASRVASDACNWPNNLEQIGEDTNSKKLRVMLVSVSCQPQSGETTYQTKETEERRCREKGHSNIVSIHQRLVEQRRGTESEQEDDHQAHSQANKNR